MLPPMHVSMGMHKNPREQSSPERAITKRTEPGLLTSTIYKKVSIHIICLKYRTTYGYDEGDGVQGWSDPRQENPHGYQKKNIIYANVHQRAPSPTLRRDRP
jgi:hypothetical protein